MSEQVAEVPEVAAEQSEQKSDTDEPTLEARLKALEAENEKVKALHRKQEERAKANAEKAKAYDELKASQMSEQEKAVEQAKADARAEAFRETAPERVRLAFEAVAGSRLTADQIEEFLEDVDTTRYLTDTGAVDRERVTKKVDALAPKQDEDTSRDLFPDLGQGKRLDASASLDPVAADIQQIEADLAAAKRR